MTVHGFLKLRRGNARACAATREKQAVHRAVEMCFLEAVLHQSVETLSKGYRHRTCFAQSIIHDPGRAGAGRADRRARPEPEARGAAV